MKRVIIILLLLNSYVTISQVVFQGNVILEGYLGFPNFGKALLTSSLTNYTSVQFNGLAPSGFRGEYMINDNVGLGIDYIRNYADITYKEVDTSFVNDYIVLNSSDMHSSMHRTRVQIRLNYHFESFSPRLDTYFGFGLGSNYRSYKSTRNGVDNIEELMNKIQLLRIPFSARVCFGSRYYFSQYVGIVGEVGFGGPLVSIGLSLKY